MRLLVLALAVGMMTLVPAAAHQARSGFDYDSWCCNGGDCSELPDDAVEAGPDGWIVTLKKGEHPMVQSPQVRHVIPYRPTGVTRIKPSGDGKFISASGQASVMCAVSTRRRRAFDMSAERLDEPDYSDPDDVVEEIEQLGAILGMLISPDAAAAALDRIAADLRAQQPALN